MKIKGKERCFEFNVQSHEEIAKLCRDDDISNLPEIMTNTLTSADTIISMAIAMNRGFEDHRAYDNPNYKAEYLEKEDFRFLTMAEMKLLEKEIMDAMNFGNKTEIETEEPKKKEEESEAKKSS